MVHNDEVDELNQGDGVCKFAYENPQCPYLSLIKNNVKFNEKMQEVLVGDDLQSGLVAKVNYLMTANKVLVALATFLLGITGTVLVKVFLG